MFYLFIKSLCVSFVFTHHFSTYHTEKMYGSWLWFSHRQHFHGFQPSIKGRYIVGYWLVSVNKIVEKICVTIGMDPGAFAQSSSWLTKSFQFTWKKSSYSTSFQWLNLLTTSLSYMGYTYSRSWSRPSIAVSSNYRLESHT